MGRRRKRREVEERQARQELRRQARTLPQVQLSQGCRMRGTGENMDGRWCGAMIYTLQEGQRGLGTSPILPQ